MPTVKPKISEGPLLLLALAVVGAICIPLWQATVATSDQGTPLTGERIARIFLGPEQIASYACFLWAMLILATRYLELRRQRRAFDLDLLPKDDDLRILPEDARSLQRRVDQLSARGGPYLLSNMVRMSLGKFALSRSPQDAGEIIRSQAEVDMGRFASTMATVHYLAWAIPAIGFVGTVRGIGLALTVAPNVDVELSSYLDETTRNLAVAFDTTLVALVLSLILMFFFHSIQRDEEQLVLDCQSYCLENLLNRLYDLGPEPMKLPEELTSTRLIPEPPWPI